MTSASISELEFSLKVHPDDIGDAPYKIDLTLSAETCAALAQRFLVTSVDHMRLQLEAVKQGAGMHVVGEVIGQVTQPCSVTLEPVITPIKAVIDHSFQPRPYIQALGLDPDDLEADIPEEMSEDGAEIGTVCLEEFTLEIPLYPRAEGAQFGAETAAEIGLDARPSPFSVLENLKKNDL